MNATARIAAAVAGGYLLGRTKKLKLAITVGSMLAGQRISTNPRELLRQGAQLIESNPELAKLSDQVRSQLLQALRAAAVSTASDSMNQLSDAIHNRTERLAVTQGADGSGEEEPEDQASDEPEDQASEEPEDQASDEPEDQASDEPEDQASDEPEDQASDEPEDQASDEPEDLEESDEEEGEQSKEEPDDPASDEDEQSRRQPAKKAQTRPSTAKKQTSKKTSKKSSASRSTKG